MPNSNSQATPAIGRLESWLIAAAGFLPFCELRPLPPIAGFWGQWLAFVLFAAWLLARRWADAKVRNGSSRPWPWVALVFVAVAGLIGLQVVADQILYRTAALVTIAELLLAAWLCSEGALAAERGQGAKLLEAFSWGAVAAAVANGASIVLAYLGWELSFVHVAAYGSGGREVGLISQANHLGTLSVLSWVAASYLHLRGRLRAAPYWAVAALGGALCAGSASRTAIIIYLLAVSLHLLFAHRQPASDGGPVQERGSPWGWRVAALVFGASLLAVSALRDVSHANTSSAPAVSLVRASVGGRAEMLSDAWQLGARHPAWGVGYGNYAKARLFELTGPIPAANADQAHNLFAQIWAELGVPGLGVVLAGVVVLLASLRKRWRSGIDGPAALLTGTWVFGLLVHSQLEHPLWFAYFLFPFAWMAGMLSPQGVVVQHVRQSGRRGVGLAGVVVMGLCVVAALDYWRSERLATHLLAQIRSNPGGVAHLNREEAMRIANLTLFPASADVMQLRAMDIDGMLPDLKLEVATRAVSALPTGETLARYLAFLVLSGKEQEATAFRHSVCSRNAGLCLEVGRGMAEFARANPALARFERDFKPEYEATKASH